MSAQPVHSIMESSSLALSRWLTPLRGPRAVGIEVLLQLAYAGVPFHGWQQQGSAKAPRTVEAQVSLALCRCLNRTVPLAICAVSRTDSGVSARDQVVRVRVPAAELAARGLVTPSSILKAFNETAHPAIRALRVRFARPSQIVLRANGAVERKRYVYYLGTGPYAPFASLQPWVVYIAHLDVDAVRRAIEAVVGTHDFAPFAVPRSSPSPSATRRYQAPQSTNAAPLAGTEDGGISGADESDDDADGDGIARTVAAPRVFSTVRTVFRAAVVELDPLNCPDEFATLRLRTTTGTDAHGKEASQQPSVHAPLTADAHELRSHSDTTGLRKRPRDGTVESSTFASSCHDDAMSQPRPHTADARAERVAVVDSEQGCAGANVDGALSTARRLPAGEVVQRVTQRNDPPVSASRLLRLEFEGNGFLRHQVRRIVGALISIGRGTLPQDFIKVTLAASDRHMHTQAAVADVDGASTSTLATASPAVALPPPDASAILFKVAPGRGLVLDSLMLPQLFWDDDGFCNNDTPGYKSDWGLRVLPIANSSAS